MKKILCLLLAAMMTLPMIACGNPDESQTEANTKNPVQSEEATEPAEILEVPDTKYDGYEMTFLSYYVSGNEWSTVDIAADGVSGDVLNDAIYDRNALIKEKYGVTILQQNTEDVQNSVKMAVSGGSSDFQAIISQTNTAANMSSTDGTLLDLSGVSYLNFDKSWWDSSATAGYSIEGHVYYTTGDLLTVDNDATFIMMFNKGMIENLHLESPYDLVMDGKWTLAKLGEMMKTAAADGGNGTMSYKDDDDTFGLVGGEEMVASVFYSAGLKLASKDADDVPVFGFELERGAEVLTWAHDNIANSKVSFVNHYVSGATFSDTQKVFASGRSLFYGECLQCVTRLRTADNTVVFGVVPYPMLNEEQGQYYGYINNVAQVVSIPKTMDGETEKIGAILEAMACYSQQYLTPAYYDRSLVGKGLRDEESAPMLDIILKNRIFDLGYIFDWGGYYGALISSVKAGTKVASLNKSYQTKFNTAMAKTIASYEKDA